MRALARWLEGDERGKIDALPLPQVHSPVIGNGHMVKLHQHVPLLDDRCTAGGLLDGVD